MGYKQTFLIFAPERAAEHYYTGGHTNLPSVP